MTLAPWWIQGKLWFCRLPGFFLIVRMGAKLFPSVCILARIQKSGWSPLAATIRIYAPFPHDFTTLPKRYRPFLQPLKLDLAISLVSGILANMTLAEAWEVLAYWGLPTIAALWNPEPNVEKPELCYERPYGAAVEQRWAIPIEVP